MILQRVVRHLRDPLSLARLIWKNICFPFTPQAAELRYDRKFGIDTSGFIEADQLGVGESQDRAYMGTPPGIASFLIGGVAQRAKDFTFLDVGSGKGRVLLIASRFPFRRVVGFEHSERMNAIAASNVRQFAKHYPDMAPVEIVCGDATRLPLPEGPLVMFLYNPLGPSLMRDFTASIKASYERSPRKIICIYYNALFPEEFTGLGIFPVQRQIQTPRDPTDRYLKLKMPTVILETADS